MLEVYFCAFQRIFQHLVFFKYIDASCFFRFFILRPYFPMESVFFINTFAKSQNTFPFPHQKDLQTENQLVIHMPFSLTPIYKLPIVFYGKIHSSGYKRYTYPHQFDTLLKLFSQCAKV